MTFKNVKFEEVPLHHHQLQ